MFKCNSLLFILFGGLLLFPHCSTTEPLPPLRVDLAGKRIDVAPVVIYADQIRGSRLRYDKSAFIGKIVFSGGFVTRKHRGSTRIQSKKIELHESSELKKEHIDWLMNSVVEGLQASGARVKTIKRVRSRVATNPDYRKYPAEGVDNIHLPRLEYRLEKVEYKGNAELLVVPILLHAYQHTAGWFYDQRIGTHPGVRLGAMIAVYDPVRRTIVETLVRSDRVDAGPVYTLSASDFQRSFQKMREKIGGEIVRWLASGG